MPRPFSSTDAADLRQAERDVRGALGERPLDFRALLAVSNIFRAATAVRNHMEGTVLASEQLSWSPFVVLFVLRVWGPQESHSLAKEAGITGGTLTGVIKTLEERGLARRRAHATDGRRVVVTSTAEGRRAIDRIMPRFNQHEALVTQDLSDTESDQLAHILRKVLRTLDALDAVAR
jgi:MarR family transcriptional regulator, organic hydroperoxide resistance regulator